MMIIESMDEDTELRRLSPIALLSDRYVDLENGFFFFIVFKYNIQNFLGILHYTLISLQAVYFLLVYTVFLLLFTKHKRIQKKNSLTKNFYFSRTSRPRLVRRIHLPETHINFFYISCYWKSL